MLSPVRSCSMEVSDQRWTDQIRLNRCPSSSVLVQITLLQVQVLECSAGIRILGLLDGPATLANLQFREPSIGTALRVQAPTHENMGSCTSNYYCSFGEAVSLVLVLWTSR